MLGPLAARGALGPLAVGSGSASSPLLSGLLAYWKLEEASGIRYDAVGTNHLADGNTVTSAAGKVGTAASFLAANTEYLSGSAPAVFSSGLARTVAFWFNLAASESGRTGTLFGVQNAFNGSDRRCTIHHSGSNPNKTIGIQLGSASAVSSGFFSTGEWHLLVYTFDGGTTHKVYSDAGTTRITKTATDAGSTAGLFLGDSAAGTLSGLIDELGIWSRVWAAEDFTLAWNGGAGRTHPF